MAILTSKDLWPFRIVATASLALVIGACSDSSSNSPQDVAGDDILMNQVQYLGTHNSYKKRIRADLFEILTAYVPDLAPTLEYSHIPLQQQFENQGIRQIELDVFDDPEGGLYATHRALSLVNEDTASDIPELDEPGLKVLHVQEVDYETTCYSFVRCLTEIKIWSDNHPGHLPITVLVEVKDEVIPDPLNLNFVIPLEFGVEALNRIDAEILSVFPPEQLIVPDDVRGDFVTLELAVLTEGWPPLSQARGKIMFALDNSGGARELYIDGHISLEGRILFTDSPAGTPEAAFMKRNNPLSNPGDIEFLVGLGYMVRTRADSDTVQSRTGDTSQREAALSSGAHFISTDYPVPDPNFSDYQVQLPGGNIARCNPISPGPCAEGLL